MKILLDTSFLLPFIQVEPNNITGKQLKEILNENIHSFFYCELSIFELTAKGMKICLGSDLTVDEIHKGIDSLVYRSPLQAINWISHPELMNIAYDIRKFHNDTLDCLIFSSAIFYSECFATADLTLLEKVKQHPELVQKIISFNNNLLIWLNDLQLPPIKFSEFIK
jgi:predicted nucleic acid-binding protein